MIFACGGGCVCFPAPTERTVFHNSDEGCLFYTSIDPSTFSQPSCLKVEKGAEVGAVML